METTSLVLKIEDDSRLEQIRSRVTSLQHEFENLQKDQALLFDRHQQQCSASLSGSLKDLFEIIFFIRKADKSLLGWHRRGDTLKLVLKSFGYDRRTSTNNEKKTAKLKTKVSKVEASFRRTTQTFDEAIVEAEDLSARFTHFSVREVDSVYHKTRSDLNGYDNDKQRIQIECESQQRKHQTLKSQVEVVTNSVQNLAESHTAASHGRAASATGSILSLSAAALCAFVFPASLAVTGTLAAGGLIAGSAAMHLNEQINDLEKEREKLEIQLNQQETHLRQVESKLAELDQTHVGVIKAAEAAQDLQLRTRGFRGEAQLALSHIREIRIVLYTTQSKLVQIECRLNECSYLESRRDIASELQYVLNSMLGIKLVKPSADMGDTLLKAVRSLTEIEANTVHILALPQEQAAG